MREVNGHAGQHRLHDAAKYAAYKYSAGNERRSVKARDYYRQSALMSTIYFRYLPIRCR